MTLVALLVGGLVVWAILNQQGGSIVSGGDVTSSGPPIQASPVSAPSPVTPPPAVHLLNPVTGGNVPVSHIMPVPHPGYPVRPVPVSTAARSAAYFSPAQQFAVQRQGN